MKYNKSTDNYSKELTDGTFLTLGPVGLQFCLWINNQPNNKKDEFIWFETLNEGLKYVEENFALKAPPLNFLA